MDGLKWKQGMQQRCVCCNKHTSWVCMTCTTGPTGLVPVCPETTVARNGKNKGQQVHHVCNARHSLNPTFMPKGKGSQRAKRARTAPEEADGVDEQCSSCSDDDMEGSDLD